MRLGDLDALKKVILSKSDSMEDLWDTAGILNAINNAPTVIPEDFMNSYEEGYRAGTLDALADLEMDAGLQEQSNLFCPRCHVATVISNVLTINYCPHCGTKMKGGEEQ